MIVKQKTRIGDWEADIIVSKGRKKAIVTLTERKSRVTLMKKIEDRKSTSVADAIIELLLPFKDYTHTITCDNGKEFAKHQSIAQALHASIYFAHPYAAWERGANENANELIRQYFPKKTDFADLTDSDLIKVMLRLNHRLRKSLGYNSPDMVFFQHLNSVALNT